MLQMSIGGLGAGALAAAIVAAVVLGVVFYGLNSGNRTEQAASLPSTQVRTPQAGDMTVGGDPRAVDAYFPIKTGTRERSSRFHKKPTGGNDAT
jgi:hypothetical protein